MSSSDIAVSVRGLSKSYTIAHDEEKHSTLAETILGRVKNPLRRPKTETFWALKDVSFDIKRGEVVGIIGRNGAGKSTLLKVLSRITQPTSGEVDIYGRVGSLLEVGTGFHPELTGRENVYLNGAILGMSKADIRKQFDAIVDFSGVEQFLDTPVKRYSSGMYVRLAFAVAAHLEPDILIVDEVLAVGDAAFQKKCLGRIGTFAREGRTVIFVSHNLTVMKGLCQTVYWFDSGSIVSHGAAYDVVETYLRTDALGMSQAVPLANLRRVGDHGSALKLTSLEWQTVLPLKHEGPVDLVIQAVAHRDVEDVSVGIGFASLDGVRLLTYETDLYGSRKCVAAGEEVSWRLRIAELPLPPGSYSIDIGCRSGDLFGLDYLPAVGKVDVVPGRRTPGNLGTGGAGVRIPSDWEWSVSEKVAERRVSAAYPR